MAARSSSPGQGFADAMIHNATTSADALQPIISASKTLIFGAATLFFFCVFLGSVFSANFDAREPPVLKSRLPFFGHIISLIRHKSLWVSKLAEHRMPIASLPMLNGKMYVVWDGILVQSIHRNRDLSFGPFIMDFAQRMLGYDDAADKMVREGTFVEEFVASNHEGMSASHVHRMNANALKYVAKKLHQITEDGIVIRNLFHWARDVMTEATTEALYGPDNPFTKDASLIDDLWTFDSQLPFFVLNLFPSITAPAALRMRNRLQSVLGEYYAKDGDQHPDAAGITKHRANALRKYGITGQQLGTFEVALLHVATTNTIPTLFWFLTYIFTRPDLVERLHEEAKAAVEPRADGEFTINVDNLDAKCPLLVSCYRETIRMSNKPIGNRRVMRDTTISDGNGRSYLLKEGINLQISGDTLHHMEMVWGPDAMEFDPERFLNQIKGVKSEAVKTQRAWWVPFGGGKHLCPGRNFATAENMGLLVTLILGYRVQPLDGIWENFKAPEQQQVGMAAGVNQPVNGGEGFGVWIKRREGWESARWRFTSGGN